MLNYNYTDLSKMIDHAILLPNLTRQQVEASIQIAIAYDVASICIMPHYLELCVERLQGTTVIPSSTVGFPHGAQRTSTKLAEATQLINAGCVELDMVCNISAALSGDWELVDEEIKAITQLVHHHDRKIKVIFENCYLNDHQKIRLCAICDEAGVDWVKTSTGFGSGGATIPDLELMLKHVNAPVQVKAAGGIKDLSSLVQVRKMGVTRVGASRTAELLGEARKSLGLPPIEQPSVSPSTSSY